MKKGLIILLILFIVIHLFAFEEQFSFRVNYFNDRSINIKNGNGTIDCPRGELKPIIKKSIYPQSTFIIQPDSLIGIEEMYLKNGDKITIKHWGCEYYALTFKIETSRLKAKINSLKYWYINTYKILKEIYPGLDAPIDIDKGLQALNNYVSRNVFELKLNTEIDFGKTEIRSYIIIDKIEKISNNKYVIEVSFISGPL